MTNTNQFGNRTVIVKLPLICIGLFLLFLPLNYCSYILNNQTRKNIKSILKLNGAIWCAQSLIPSLEIPQQRCIVLSKPLSHCVIITVYSLSLTRQSFRGSNVFIFRSSSLTECLTHEDSLTVNLLNERKSEGMDGLHALCLPFILLNLLKFLLVFVTRVKDEVARSLA